MLANHVCLNSVTLNIFDWVGCSRWWRLWSDINQVSSWIRQWWCACFTCLPTTLWTFYESSPLYTAADQPSLPSAKPLHCPPGHKTLPGTADEWPLGAQPSWGGPFGCCSALLRPIRGVWRQVEIKLRRTIVWLVWTCNADIEAATS